MKKSLKKAAAFLVTATMAVSLAGCGGGETTTGGNVNEKGYPETITAFTHKSGSIFGDMTDYNDVYSWQLIEEATGTHVEWNLPPSAGYEEKFNLMIAGGNLPDVIYTGWNSRGGVAQFIEDGVLIDMSSYVEEYMPNFLAFAKERPDALREFVSEDGKIYYIPLMRSDKRLNIYTGPLMRMDWLEKLNLEVPTNAEELYNVLKAFKTQDPNGNGQADEIPMSVVGIKGSLGLLGLCDMFGTTDAFYQEDGVIKYGVLEDEFKEALKYVSKLYQEGLVDPDTVLQNRTTLISKITNNRVGFAYEYQPTQIMTTMAESDPNFLFAGIPYFYGKDGVQRTMNSSYIRSTTDAGAAITTACEDPVSVAKWLDFLYSEEGRKITNFGKEGVTYNMVDGEVKFVDAIENNSEGLSRAQAFGKHLGGYNPAFSLVQDWGCYGQYLSKDGREAVDTWAESATVDKALPTLVFSPEDKEKLSSVYTPIETYVDETITKIILGQESIDKLDSLREEIKQRGIQEIIDIYQKTLDAYYDKDISL